MVSMARTAVAASKREVHNGAALDPKSVSMARTAVAASKRSIPRRRSPCGRVSMARTAVAASKLHGQDRVEQHAGNQVSMARTAVAASKLDIAPQRPHQ